MTTTRRDKIIGREVDLGELERLLKKARLVTVTGSPGVGKSALARAFADVHRERRKSVSVLVVPLAGAASLEAICREVGRALRVSGSPNATPDAASALTGRALAHRGRTLLVLDDADAARERLTSAITSWLVDAPQTSFIVTSRARLGLPDEARLDLAPLPVPDLDETDPTVIGDNPAVQVFVRRAAALRPGYHIASRSAARSIASVVRRVEGLPLAVELCAARITILDEHEIDELLASHAGFLSSTTSSPSLHAALTWSWAQLAPEDAELLARASVFRGSFDLAGAAAVAPAARLETIDRLGRLEAASLLRALDAESGIGARRYAVTEVIRAFAYERLVELGLEEETRQRHAEHFAARARSYSLEELMLDAENLDAAFESAFPRRPAVAARVLVALRPLALARGRLALYLERIDALLGGGGLADEELAELHLARGLARIFRGQRDSALDDLERARELARRAKLDAVDVLASSKTGMVLGLKGDVSAARGLLDEALARADALGLPHLQGVVRKDLANILSEQSADDEAIVLLSEARDFFRAAGDPREEGFVVMMIATRLFDQGRTADARRDLVAAQALLRRVGDARTETWARAILALVDLETGDHGAARSGLEAAIERVRIVGDEHTEGLLCTFQGHVALEQEIWEEAEERYRDARRLLAKAGDRGGEAMATAASAFAEAALGRFAVARAAMTRANELVEGDARPARVRTVALLGLGVRLREALATGEDVGAATSAVRAALAPRRAGAIAPPEEVRFAQRLLARMLEAGTAERLARELVVAPDGTWVKPPSCDGIVKLGRARALRLVIMRLAEERIRYPGRPVSRRALVAAGWPGERILLAAAKNRLHVTVARLRRLGLESVLLHADDGYLLDPNIPTRIAESVSEV